MRYLVTGAAGFIGAAVADKLIHLGNEVVTIDNLSTGSVEHIPEGVKFIEGSTSDENSIRQLNGERFDAIIHIAGQSSGEISFDNPVYDLQTNCQSTLMLLDYARKTKCHRFIYASTMSVYGDHNPPKCSEETELAPKSFYAVGKIGSEHYMRIYSKQYGIICTSLRLFNTYGIGQNMKNLKQGMASIYLAMAINDHKITVKGSKDRFRDFVYIDDVVDAFVRSLSRDADYDVFNICTGRSVTVETVVNSIINSLPFDVCVEYVEGTPGDQFGIFGDNRKAIEILGWNPKVTFDEGIEKMTKWALSV
jgi:UDP-glucose 4-epimerase